MRLLAVSIERFGGGSVRSMSVISTARVLRLGQIQFRIADRRQPGRPAGHPALPALRPPTDRSTTTTRDAVRSA